MKTKIENLIKDLEKLAEKYNKHADNTTNEYTVERLYASAEILKLCADQLRKIIKRN